MALRLYDWDLTKQPKVAPKWPKETSFGLFSTSSETDLTIRTKFCLVFFTILESFICNGIKIIWLRFKKQNQKEPQSYQETACCELLIFFQKLSKRFERSIFSHSHRTTVLFVQWQKSSGSGLRNIAKNSPKTTKKSISDIFQFSQNSAYKIFYSRSMPYWSPICAMYSKFYGCDLRYIARRSPEWTKKWKPLSDFFLIFSNASLRFERKFLVMLTILVFYMCNGIKVVWLRFETSPGPKFWAIFTRSFVDRKVLDFKDVRIPCSIGKNV